MICKKAFGQNCSGGFSLIELMLVVGILGILSTAVQTYYGRFKAKAKQAELTMNLRHIHTLADAYMLDNSSYGASNVITSNADTGNCGTLDYCNAAGNYLGFHISVCDDRNYDYYYIVNPTGYTAYAREITGLGSACIKHRTVFPGCAVPFDYWSITPNGTMTDISNAINSCF